LFQFLKNLSRRELSTKQPMRREASDDLQSPGQRPCSLLLTKSVQEIRCLRAATSLEKTDGLFEDEVYLLHTAPLHHLPYVLILLICQLSKERGTQRPRGAALSLHPRKSTEIRSPPHCALTELRRHPSERRLYRFGARP
jgi:hypothetical protein